MIDPAEADAFVRLFRLLGDALRDGFLAARARAAEGEFASVASVTATDTIYQVDRICEKTIVDWFSTNWPADHPVEVVMEGHDDSEPLTFPKRTPVHATRWKCILDPIDGTRSLMHDKRPGWVLGGLAPQRGSETNLADIVVAVMTELPTSKQGRADQIAAVKGRGADGVVSSGYDLRAEQYQPLTLRPSHAADFRHGLASFARFFPEGKSLTARLEEELWERLGCFNQPTSPLVFDDQYASTGGQLYELLAGHDCMAVDIRPLVFRKLGLDAAHVCHPYDICTALVLQEAGGIVEAIDGSPLQLPLDTTSPVSWVGFANTGLAELVRPHLREILAGNGLT